MVPVRRTRECSREGGNSKSLAKSKPTSIPLVKQCVEGVAHQRLVLFLYRFTHSNSSILCYYWRNVYWTPLEVGALCAG
jgi:hypothetical protein